MHFNMLYVCVSISLFLSMFFSLLVPTAAPTNVQVGMLNLTSGVVRWSAPPPQHHNGILLGYKIQVKAGNSTKILAQMTLNSSTLSVGLHNLTTGATYSARVVAYTRVGAGPYSKPVKFSTRIKGIN